MAGLETLLSLNRDIKSKALFKCKNNYHIKFNPFRNVFLLYFLKTNITIFLFYSLFMCKFTISKIISNKRRYFKTVVDFNTIQSLVLFEKEKWLSHSTKSQHSALDLRPPKLAGSERLRRQYDLLRQIRQKGQRLPSKDQRKKTQER